MKGNVTVVDNARSGRPSTAFTVIRIVKCNAGLFQDRRLMFWELCGSITCRLGTLLVAQFVKALRYKLEGHRFDSRWCHWNFSVT